MVINSQKYQLFLMIDSKNRTKMLSFILMRSKYENTLNIKEPVQ